jgi:YfiH family protein
MPARAPAIQNCHKMQRITPPPPHQTARALAGVKHGFFGREGGVSSGIYSSLNAGTGSGDVPANVLENRTRIAATFGVDRDHLCGVHQVHSATAYCITGPFEGERPHGDALVTTTPGVAISILTADCAPILFADAEAGVIGAAHAGWRGALAGVIENTVRLMVDHGAQGARIVAAIGPCIHQSSYEVGPEFEAEFRAADPGFARFLVPGAGDRFHFDLPNFCAARLTLAGVETIETLPLDTYAESTRLHSHRRSVHEKAGDYGRNCSVIMLG